MWKKIFKVVFYIAFAMMLLLVVGGSVVCFIYAAMEKEARFWLFGALTLFGGTIVTFVAFAFTGMVIEMMDNIEMIRKKMSPSLVQTFLEKAKAMQLSDDEDDLSDTDADEEDEEEAKETEEAEPSESWICPTCGLVNPGSDQFCTTCGTKKH